MNKVQQIRHKKILNIIIRHNKKVQRNLEYKLTGLHFSKAYLSGLIRWGGLYLQERLSREHKNKLDKSEKS